ncbi:MAG: tRNA pseudouridine(55) synthase TruB [Chloroflexi bacterium]|nr:tRNA pseudouridine(55) synthase TruB [Chloroflexota bacterium]
MGHDVFDGIINLNKPQGKTSFQMVALVRRLSGVRKVGHSGTLDPDATGVLPILIGRATRLASFLTDSRKTYRAEVEFGTATDTYDSSGNVVQTGDSSSLTIEQVEAALSSFRGSIEQIPPMFSAIKHQGKPLYHLARAGIEVPRNPRKVTIFELDIISWKAPILSIEVECSKGTYIRSLAHDLGQMLECGAHLKSLVRTQSGPFTVDESVSITQLEECFKEGKWQTIVHSPDFILGHLDSVMVGTVEEDSVIHGRPFTVAEGHEEYDGEQRRAYSSEGRFLALVKFDREKGLWKPVKVFT